MYTFEELRKVLNSPERESLLTDKSFQDSLNGILCSNNCFFETVLNIFVQPKLQRKIVLEQVPEEWR